MASSYFLDPFIIHFVGGKNKRILDIGCCKGKWGSLLKEGYNEPKFQIGIDIYMPYLEYCNEHKIYDGMVICDARNLPFKDNSFDVSIACEVIEHLKKEDGDLMLKEAERVTKERLIVSTPNFFQSTPQSTIKYQEHISLWNLFDFYKRGFRVRGVGFSFLGIFSHPVLSILFYPIGFIFPLFSMYLLAIKKLKK